MGWYDKRFRRPVRVSAAAFVAIETLKELKKGTQTESVVICIDDPATIRAFTKAPRSMVAVLEHLEKRVRSHLEEDGLTMHVFAAFCDNPQRIEVTTERWYSQASKA